jgi:hypothetical protein
VKEPAKFSLVAAAVVVALVVAAIALKHEVAAAPFEVREAGLTGELWVMPGKAVPAFLKSHDAPALAGPPTTEPTVVGRVAWSGREGEPEDARVTILLGDDNGGAGSVQEVLGRPEGQVTLGSGSMWNSTTKRTSWLRGNAPIELDGRGWTDYGQFASLPVTPGGFVWFVGRITDTPTDGSLPTAQGDARPVVGVALSTGDRVWWVKRVASADVSPSP